jgi:nucleoside-diphosphate-sugar epimerase
LSRACAELSGDDEAPTAASAAHTVVSDRVLVTGAAGRIGSAVVFALVDAGFEVVGLDRRRPTSAVEEAVSSFFIGSGSDRGVAGRACSGVSAVVHLGAIPSPVGHDPSEVFVNNVSSTFSVLFAACDAGARAGVIASSVSALGLVYSPTPISPIYAPIDEDHPLRPRDPYALAKQCDEHTAAMMSGRFGMTVLAYRFPFTASAERIAARAAANRSDPADGARELWAYLDVRDAAEACLVGVKASLDGSVRGCHVLNVIADDALVDEPMTEMISKFHPETTVRSWLGPRSCGYTVSAARQLIGFSARHLRE